MTMPGFTAERSLHACKTRFASAAVKFPAADARIHPQLTMCRHLERRLNELGPELGLAAASEDWEAFTNSLQSLQNTLTAHRNGRC